MEPTTTRRPFDLDRTVRLLITIACIVGAFMLVRYLRDVLLPFLVACLLAYIIHPLVLWNQRKFKIKSEPLAVTFALLEIALGLVLILWFLIPYLYSEIAKMATQIAEFAKAQVAIPFIPSEVQALVVKYLDFKALTDLFSQEQLFAMAETALMQVWQLMGSSIMVLLAIVSWVVVLLYLVFILIDYSSIVTGLRTMIPQKYSANVVGIISDIARTMNLYFRGQALVALCVGILFSIGFLIVGLPMAVAFGLFIGVLNMVPYLQLASIPIAAVLCLVQAVTGGQNFWLLCGETTIVYIVVQTLQDLVITPKIMGKTMGLNPATIFLSLSIWGALLGFVGLIIALPLTTLCISYYKRYILNEAPESTVPAPKKPDIARKQPRNPETDNFTPE